MYVSVCSLACMCGALDADACLCGSAGACVCAHVYMPVCVNDCIDT